MDPSNFNLIINSKFNEDKSLENKTLKLVISNNRYSLLSPKDIKSDMECNINSIADSIAQESKAKVDKLDAQQTIHLLNNVKWIDTKLKNHNSKIKNSFLLSICNFILKLFGSGLKYNRLTDTIKELELRVKIKEKQQQKEIAKVNANLANNKIPEKQEFKKSNHQPQPVQLHQDQSEEKQYDELMTRLQIDTTFIGTLQSRNALQKIQNDPILQEGLIRYIPRSELHGKNPNFINLLKALTFFKTHTEDFKREPDFLMTLYFAEKERHSLFPPKTVFSKRNYFLHKYRLQLRNKILTLVFQTRTNQLVKVESELGKGAYKIVKKVLDFRTRTIITVGRIYLKSNPIEAKEQKSSFENEVNLMNRCKDIPQVLKCISSYSRIKMNGTEKLVIVTPYCNKNTLADNLKSLTEKEKYKVVDDIFKGIKKIHSKQNIIHRDLKPENIYLHREIDKDGKEGELKAFIADFGLSCDINSSEIETPCGTPLYMPPEILQDITDADYASDAYALGIILSEIFQGKKIYLKNLHATYEPQTTPELLRLIKNTENDPAPANKFSIDFIAWGLTRRKFNRMAIDRAYSTYSVCKI